VKHTLVLALALALALTGGCSFNPGNSNTDLGTTGGDDLAGGDDMTSGPDLTVVCTAGVKTCSGTTLSTCNLDGTAVDTATCVLGCNTAGNDCNALSPTAPAVSSDFSYGGLSDPTITAALLVFDTDSGEIRDGANAVVRMPNAAPQTRFVENGIGFHRVSGVGIWTFSKLTVPTATTIVFKSAYAASILSATDLTIAGTIDLRGYGDPTQAKMATTTLCAGGVAGPGGTNGGSGATAATGMGAGGQPDTTTAGGGGGGYGDVGAAGGNDGGNKGGKAGVVSGGVAINPLAGGFGGGSSGGNGGGGGGALQLAAQGAITISGQINAGGCGGAAGDATHGGGGGGSGGAVLVEAPTVHVTATGVLAANGGGGGAGGSATSTAGDPGAASSTQANGGAGLAGGHNGGSGDALGATAGTGTNGAGAGAGGGGVGRVRVNTRTGAAVLDLNYVISPAATQGTVTIQ
jgi:hypothetical protein